METKTTQPFDYFAVGPAPEGIPFPEYYNTFMDWRFPLIMATAYVIGVWKLNPNTNAVSRAVAQAKGLKPSSKKSSPFMTAFVFAHNMVLAVFSAATFFTMAPAVLKSFLIGRNSFREAYCDSDGCLWRDALGYWGYLFYLSKYYEIIDTIIILVKGRRSSLLQTYHHAGAIITMWAGIFYAAAPIWIFVVFNSFIHTIMYTYYGLTSVGINPPGKQYLTTMQITQFMVGTPLATSYLFVNGCARNPGQRLAIWINVSYLFPLTYLFVDFARKMYGGRKSRTPAKAFANGHANGYANDYANGDAKKVE